MLKMPMIFSDHMVLQRRKPIAVWGDAAPNAAVRICLTKDGSVVAETNTTANGEGAWLAHLPSLEAAWGLELQIVSETECVSFQDVLVGEVWIAGGQSNMEYYLYFDAEKEEALQKEENPNVRFFDYPEIAYEEQLGQYEYPEHGFWHRCRSEELPWFSAVGYYFAEKVQEALDVPVGIVGCNWGGTRACCWMDKSYLEGTPGQVWLDQYYKSLEGVDLDAYRHWYRDNPANAQNHPIPGDYPIVLYPGMSREMQLQAMERMAQFGAHPFMNLIGPDHHWRPCGLYETMLKKIVPYTAKGVIWYQGESDSEHPHLYTGVLSAMIRNWRDLWQDELPFLMVQLAPFGEWMNTSGVDYPIVRKCQEEVCATVPGTYLASSSDCGMEWDIHPKHKKPVGQRLALLARGHIYGEEILCDAPAFHYISRSGTDAVLHFKNAGGLHLKDGDETVNALLVNGQAVTAKIEDNTVILSLPDADSWKIEFANTGYYEVNLYNGAGIPAMPFAVELAK